LQSSGTDAVRRLLLSYRNLALAATGSFFFFLALLALLWYSERTNIAVLFILLLSGFLWIGLTSLSRHAFVSLKRHIRVDVGSLEFLSTQLVFFHFPIMYGRIRREAEGYSSKGHAQ